MSRLLICAALLSLGVFSAQAVETRAVSARSGATARVGGGWSCETPYGTSNVRIIQEPANGTVEVRFLPHGSPCNRGPMQAVFYRSNPGFRGTDEVAYMVDSVGRRGSSRYSQRINVR
jgi:hypothetical protein